MTRFKLTLEYAGTRYSGWQIQKNARTVQGELDRAIRTVTKREKFELYGSGRTDAGVHALAQVAHLDVGTSLPPATLLTRLNDGQGTAGQLLQDKKLYENMNGAVADMRALLTEIRKDPKKYLNVKVSIF